MSISLEQWAEATGSNADNALRYYDAAVAAMERYEIVTAEQIAAFCATISIESARLTTMEESLYYKHPERLLRIFPRAFSSIEEAQPFCRNPAALSQKLYNGYHGRGAIQLTWERNYLIHSRRTGNDYLRYPEKLLEPEHALLSAASFWDLNLINDVAYDMGEVTLRVNGPARLHLAERIAQYDTALAVLA